MKKIIIILLFSSFTLFVMSCKLSSTELAVEVKKSMYDTWEKEGITGITIDDLTVTHLNANEYTGLLETTEDGEKFKRSVKIVYDGENMQWEILE